ncbi:hypothetical protein ACRRTK_000675 [Alexandromys fortis]
MTGKKAKQEEIETPQPHRLFHNKPRISGFKHNLDVVGCSGRDTDVITLLNTVHYDSEQFKTPREFNPEHFLDDNQSFKKSPAFMPFSAGRRLCLGEPLARMELFIYLTSILQNFTLQPLVEPEDIDLTPLSSGCLVMETRNIRQKVSSTEQG